ncbi:protein adenylyltransferase SelO family protein [Corynebacterium flavescens]
MQLSHDYAEHLPQLVRLSQGEEQPDPQLLFLNEPLARELGFDPGWLRSPAGLDLLLGHDTAHAMAYSGFQFGQFNPYMGDGRALLLGEARVGDDFLDLHAKGTGLTPFSRPGSDGRATLSSILREYLVSEAMHALGVPTTRGLAVISTGRKIQRGHVRPAGVGVRVAASHLRVGTFHYAQLGEGTNQLQALADYAIARHYPVAIKSDNPYRDFFQLVVESQMRTVAKWQRLGFIHGVMNTDNTTISGQTIDYGPCAFMESYDLATVFSSIDNGGRYAYGNQPHILGWNLARLAESLLPLFSPDPNEAVSFAQEVMDYFPERFEEEMSAQWTAALDTTPEVFASYREALARRQPDLTQAHRALVAAVGGDSSLARELFDGEDFLSEYLASEPSHKKVDESFPRVIPRNRQLDAALKQAEAGDFGAYREMLEAVTHPWRPHPHFEEPDPTGLADFMTFCGT